MAPHSLTERNEMKRVSSRRVPIYRDTAFPFEKIEDAQQAFVNEAEDPQSSESYIYSRYGNPTVVETEDALAKLEGSKWALLTSSGMAAIDVALSVFQEACQTGPWLFFSELYGGTILYIQQVLQKRRGITVEWLEPEDGKEGFNLDTLEKKLDRLNPTLLFFEPVTNPLLIVVDGKRVIEMARARKIKTIVDNTFATPNLWHPLESGADLVVHSATKYLGGHGNITAGVVAGNSCDLRMSAMIYRKLAGNILSPDDAYRLGTQLKTFHLRFPRQCENAFRLACESPLRDHPAVKRVRYPGLGGSDTRHETHDEAQRMFGESKAYGAMITLELKGGRKACDYFVENLANHLPYLVTLGDAESTLLHVATVFGEEKYPFPGMIRMSIGFERYEDIESAVLRALDAIPYC